MNKIINNTFKTVIKNSNLIVRDHRVHNVRIMPGVTFIDLIYRLLQSEGYRIDEVELRNVLFVEPVSTTEDYDCQLELQIEKHSLVKKITIRSRKVRGNNIVNPNWSVNLTCELHFNTSRQTDEIDIASFKDKAIRIMDVEEIYEKARSLNINHYEFMKGLGKIFVQENEILGEIHLSELAKKYLKNFTYHPAYMDCSTFFPFYFDKESIDKPYIPIFIESFKGYNKLDDSCYVYVKRNEKKSQSSDTMSNDYTIYNKGGKIVAQFKRFSSKHIRSKDLIVKLTDVDKENLGLNVQANITATGNVAPEGNTLPKISGTVRTGSVTQTDIEDDLSLLIAHVHNKSPKDVNREIGFYDQGLDSTQLISLVQQLETKVGEQLYPTLLFEYNNIKDLAGYLNDEFGDKYQCNEAVAGNAGHNINNTAELDIENLYFSNNWVKSDLSGVGKSVHSNSVVIFDVDDKNYSYLKSVQQNGAECILVKPGESFAQVSESIFEIDPLSDIDYIKLAEKIEEHGTFPNNIIHMWSRKVSPVKGEKYSIENIEDHLNYSIYSVFFLSKALLQLKHADKIQLLYVFQSNEDGLLQPAFSAISGFAKTLILENPKFDYKTIEIDQTNQQSILSFNQIIDITLNEFLGNADKEIRYEDGDRYVKNFTEFDPVAGDALAIDESVLKNDGVYLITGGVGGLGLVFAEYLAQNSKPTIILNGRSDLTEEKQEKLDQLRETGATVVYYQADISRKNDTKKLLKKIKSEFKQLTGIIHCAGVIRDAIVLQKKKEEMDSVFGPKIYGTLHLDDLTKKEDLDFFVLFSSTAAAQGNFGQSDYAYANSFMDSFAFKRNQLIGQRKRSGKTVSINWPLWKDGGMQLDESTMKQITQKLGIVPLSTESGIKAFDIVLKNNYEQVMTIEGDRKKIERALFGSADTQTAGQEALATGSSTGAHGHAVITQDQMSAVKPKSNDLEDEQIAIIGLNGQYPMARDLDEFWENLKNGKDCITEIPEKRWDYTKYFDTDKEKFGKTYSKWGGFIDDYDKFDPLFFNMSPKEAVFIDPQERLFLETVWQTVEDAGYTKESLKKDIVGVFVGVMWGQYQLLGTGSEDAMVSIPSVYASIGNRVSYFFDFKGPSIALDTMCSSSLTALQFACDSILKGESDYAIAGGVNLSIHPSKYNYLSLRKFLSSDGKCRSFGEGGDGYVPGEGVGAVLLKPLSKAIADGDNIYGVIKGIAVNHGGRTSGYSVPNPKAQGEVIKSALQKAKVNPRAISYIEAHGTGTSLGDPIEINGMTKAFSAFTKDNQFCAVGSVKSNIGHLESAAGISGLTKILLQMKHKQLVPSLHSKTLNPTINFSKTPFVVQQKLNEWKRPVLHIDNETIEYPRIAGLSSFGAGGTNVHIVIEEHIPEKEQPESGPVSDLNPVLIVLSAKDDEGLKERVQQLLTAISKQKFTDSDLRNMAYTLQVGREAMEERLATVVITINELESKLLSYLNDTNKHSDLYINNIENSKKRADIFSKDEDSHELINTWIEKRKYALIAELWTEGVEIDWKLIHKNEKYKRISLPVYPFKRDRYWINHTIDFVTNTGTPNVESSAEQIDQPVDREVDEQVVQLNVKQVISGLMDVPVEKINIESDFLKYGFDSISAMQIVNKLNETYSINLSPKEVFERESIKAFSQYVYNEFTLHVNDRTPVNIQTDGTGLDTSVYPLSAGQMGLWVIKNLAPENYAYNVPSAFRIKQAINTDILKDAFETVIQRHPAFRTRISIKDNEPVQEIMEEADLRFETVDISNVAEENIDSFIKEKVRVPFDFNSGSLIRVHLLSKSSADHILLITAHHIIYDGSSIQILLKELYQLYMAGKKGDSIDLPSVTNSYAGFVQWQSEMLAGTKGEEDKQYWQKTLSDEFPILDLPMEKERSNDSEFQGDLYLTELSEEVTAKIHDISKVEKVSPFVLMLCAYVILLHSYSNEEDIIIGTPVHGRPNSQFDDVIGYFINMILIRSAVSPDQSLRDLLKQVQSTTLDAMEHGNYPFSEVIKQIKGLKNRGYSPVVQAVFTFHNWLKNTMNQDASGTIEQNNDQLQLDPIPTIFQEGEFDLSLEAIKDNKKYGILLKYNPELFSVSTIERMASHYKEIVCSIVENLEQNISEITFLTDKERDIILLDWNKTTVEYPKEKCIQQLFEEQVQKNPDSIAVMYGDKSLTYSELHKKSNQLARILRDKGVNRNSIVGIMVERSIEMSVGIFSIIKAGGAYMPIDPHYPADRVEYMLDNSKAEILLVHNTSKDKMKFSGSTINLDDESLYTSDDSDLDLMNKPTDLAYIIYTSGSTGNPKGVMIEHHSLINRLKWMQKSYPLTQEDAILQKTPYTFDVSVWEMFWWSFEGARLCYLKPQGEKDPQAIVDAIHKYNITVMHFVPSMLNIFLEYIKSFDSVSQLASLKQVYASGEALSPAHVRLFNNLLFKQNNTKLMNLYGPTEASIDVSYFDCSTGEDFHSIPIGKPIDNTQLVVINKSNQLQPVGVPGELCIAGVQLARGYLNNKKLTDEKFVANPFEPGTKMYKTGDLAKWLPDGNIAFLGRIDRQLKIRGFRIELGEIENALSDHDLIKDVCVTVDSVKDITGSDQLIAYIVSHDSQEIQVSLLRDYLKSKLPEYMVPASFVQMDSLPLTAHGKVNVKELMNLAAKQKQQKPAKKKAAAASSKKEDPATSDIKSKLSAVYSEMLGVDEVDPADNFFDIGGHSILMVKISIKLKEEYGLEVTTVDLFQYPTINSLAQHLNQKNKSTTFTKSKNRAQRQREILMKLNS